MTTAEKIVVAAGLIVAQVPLWILISWRSDEKRTGIELPKSDCIEICVKVSQRESVWPKEYHQLVQRCNDIFAEVETCRLR